MNGKSNVKLPKYAYQYWHENKEQALENWMNLLTDDVRLESLADGALDIEFTRLYHCTNDVLGYFEGLSTDWEMIFYKVDNDLSEGDRVVASGNYSWRFRRSGREVQTPTVDVVTFKDSEITEFFALYDSAKMIACTQE